MSIFAVFTEIESVFLLSSLWGCLAVSLLLSQIAGADVGDLNAENINSPVV